MVSIYFGLKCTWLLVLMFSQSLNRWYLIKRKYIFSIIYIFQCYPWFNLNSCVFVFYKLVYFYPCMKETTRKIKFSLKVPKYQIFLTDYFYFCRIGRKSARLVRAAAMKLSQELYTMIDRPQFTVQIRNLQG